MNLGFAWTWMDSQELTKIGRENEAWQAASLAKASDRKI
jgi:hypothetical protein